jgi:hypothetical protein
MRMNERLYSNGDYLIFMEMEIFTACNWLHMHGCCCVQWIDRKRECGYYAMGSIDGGQVVETIIVSWWSLAGLA